MLGLDTNRDCSSIAEMIVADGRQFVCRYYAHPGSKKGLMSDELQKLRKANLKVVAVWENGYPTSAGYFSYSQGVNDGVGAYKYAVQIGQPAGTPIYFAVDYDASTADLNGGIANYFKGVAFGMETAARGASKYAIGVYGSGESCIFALSSGFATYSWLSMSTGWSGHTFGGWNIRQSKGRKFGDIDVDFDESSDSDFGAF